MLTVSCTALNQEEGQWRLEKNVVTLSMLADLPHFNFWIALSISDKEISEITGLYKLCTHAIVLYWSYRQWECMVSMSSDGIGSFCGATGRIWGLDGCSKSLSMI